MNEHTIRRVRATVSGRVQGVYFRAATREVAADLGLSGWVRNLPDGRVEAVLQGPAATVDKAVEFCRSGPPTASVEDLELTELEPVEHERGFDVR